MANEHNPQPLKQGYSNREELQLYSKHITYVKKKCIHTYTKALTGFFQTNAMSLVCPG